MEQPNAILAPGLINTHTHAAMSLFRGVADDLKLQDWLEKYIFPAEAKNVDREFVRWGTRLGLLEMALSGTTTFADMYYFEDTVAEETKKAGMRGVLGQTVIGFPAPDYKTPEAALAGAETFLKAYADDPLIMPAVAPHAIYTTSDETLQAARTLADRYGKPLIIHLAETKANFDEAMQKRKKTPTATLADLGVLNGWTLVGARRVARPGGFRSSAGGRNRDRALPVEQHDAGQRRRAGAENAAGRHSGGIGNGRRGGLQQRCRHDGRDGSGGQAAEGDLGRSDGASRRAGLRHGDHHGRAGVKDGRSK